MKKPIESYGPEILNILSIIGIASKGCANTYTRFFNGDNIIISEIQSKWADGLSEEISANYIEIALQNMRKLPISAYTKYVLLKLLDSRIATNKKLFDMKLIADATCVYCKAPSETIIHVFIECPEAANLWKKMEHWLRSLVDPGIKIGDVEKIFCS